ncbi:MAG: hypothetical protein V4722_06125 [Bacteroidota bacterium]
MKKISLSILFLAMVIAVGAQQLAQVNFSGATQFSYFSFITDGNVLIRVSDDGRVLEWGTEEQSLRNSNYYSPKLQPYPGRVAFYGQEADSAARGKVKTIGSSEITYYGAGSMPFKMGKIRSVGSQQFDYFSNFDNKALQGKVKTMGMLQVDYYGAYENEAFKGKIKLIGNSPITYYSSFDDKLIKGKIKTIGGTTYSWYTSFDRPGYGGGLKSGQMRQAVNGITYVLY